MRLKSEPDIDSSSNGFAVKNIQVRKPINTLFRINGKVGIVCFGPEIGSPYIEPEAVQMQLLNKRSAGRIAYRYVTQPYVIAFVRKPG